jgi:secreted protein with Ig-like and vWFA domain
MLNRIRTEPALVTGLVSALIALGVAFGLDLTGEQTGAIMAVTAAVMAVVVRAQVTPNASVAARQHHGETVAGPAADVPTGEPATVVPAADERGILGKA